MLSILNTVSLIAVGAFFVFAFILLFPFSLIFLFILSVIWLVLSSLVKALFKSKG